MDKILVALDSTNISINEMNIYQSQLSEKEKIKLLKQFKKYSQNILNIFVNGKRLDKILADMIDKTYFGLVPSLIDWYDEDYAFSKQEKAYIIKKCSFDEGTYILPILLCPDDFGFTCTIISVEVIIDRDKVIWNRFGLDRSKGINSYGGTPIQVYDNNGNELLGRRIDWFENMPKYVFDKKEYKIEINKFLNVLTRSKVNTHHWRYSSLEDLAKDLDFVNNITVTDKLLIIKFHEDFVIKIRNVGIFYTYINDVFYYDIEDQDIWYSLKEITDNDDIIVQYKHKHGFFTRNKFYFYQKNDFNIEKVKWIKDVYKIFDNKKLIFSAKVD